MVAIGKAKDQIEAFRKEFAEDPLVSVEMADVRDTDALKAVRDGLSGLDILVPNAGVATRVEALVTPVVLRWARENDGHTVDFVAKKLKVTADDVAAYYPKHDVGAQVPLD